MRQIIFTLVFSAILMPMASVQQGLFSDQSLSGSELRRSLDTAVEQVSHYYRRAEKRLLSTFHQLK
jgi:hypothetical protein